MRIISIFVLTLCSILLTAFAGNAQVITPAEIKDPGLRELQMTYLDDLQQVGREILALKLPYPFYLSRKLDLDLDRQKVGDQRGIRFDTYGGQTVLAISGNYYAAYSADKMGPDRRARETYLNVVYPILQAAVPRFQNVKAVDGFAVEISHHVRGKVMDVEMEHPENLFMFFPRSAALKLLSAKDDSARQSAILAGQAMLNGDAVSIWLEGVPADVAKGENAPQQSASEQGISKADGGSAPGPDASPKDIRTKQAPVTPHRDTSPAALSTLETVNGQTIGNLTKDLQEQAHLVAYAPPAFMVFREGIYLQLSLNTDLGEPLNGSRYALAALAFDEHISRLVRPAMKYFKDEQQFDGLDFSTTVHVPGSGRGNQKAESVEFVFPFSALRCYEKYDCTGQELIDAGAVLINGERVRLDLEVAEGAANH